MKKLQNNFTTPEQSKRLLKLGVPADSADMFYFAIGNSKENYDRGIFYETPDVLKRGNIFHELTKNTLPSWSVGRLIEIRDICANYYITHADFNGNYIEDIIISFYAIHATNGFDFSKLEE